MIAERYFLALDLPEAHRRLLSDLRVDRRGFAWTRPQQIHLTLRFIGPLEPERVEGVVEALGGIRVAPFFLPLEGLGVFPQRGAPRVLWAGVGRGHPHLFQLRQRADDALLALGLELDLRTFHPHATIARLKPGVSPAAAADFIKQRRGFEGPPFRVESFALYSSVLLPSGAEHALVASFPLAASAGSAV